MSGNRPAGSGRRRIATAAIGAALLLAYPLDRGLFARDPPPVRKQPASFADSIASVIVGHDVADSAVESLVWEQKFTILDYKKRNAGYVNIELAKIAIRSKRPFYRARIKTRSDLPFWFFSGKSITDETEYYDEEFIPLCFELKLSSEQERVILTGQRADGGGAKGKLDLRWTSEKKERSAQLPLLNNICTGGSVRSIVLGNGVSKRRQYDLQLLDKYKLAYQKVKVTTGDTTKVAEKPCYKIDLQLGLLGRFYFIVDKDGSIIEGQGMGIRLVPVR